MPWANTKASYLFTDYISTEQGRAVGKCHRFDANILELCGRRELRQLSLHTDMDDARPDSSLRPNRVDRQCGTGDAVRRFTDCIAVSLECHLTAMPAVGGAFRCRFRQVETTGIVDHGGSNGRITIFQCARTNRGSVLNGKQRRPLQRWRGAIVTTAIIATFGVTFLIAPKTAKEVVLPLCLAALILYHYLALHWR
jgi:hypothetical protein